MKRAAAIFNVRFCSPWREARKKQPQRSPEAEKHRSL